LSKFDILALDGIHPLYRAALETQFNLHGVASGAAHLPSGVNAAEVVGIAASGESRVLSALIEQLPSLKVISVFGVGYDGIDTATAIDRGVTVTHTPGVLSDDVADLAIGLMLSVARAIPQADGHVKAGRWPHGGLPLAKKVSGARIGIVGLGRIGQAIARRARGFDMSIAYTARSEKKDSSYKYFPDTVSLAKNVDFLIVITPGGAATKHLIDAHVLSALGKNGFLINVARGSVVDEAALVSALSDGVIAGAGLDVFADEPNVPEALRSMPNVVLTPHIASATVQTRQAMADLAFTNMQNVTKGLPAMTPVPEMAANCA
jgi:hydroxypyruvate reductase